MERLVSAQQYCISAFWALTFIFVLTGAAYALTPVEVGVTLPLTGAFSEFGEAVKNGLSMALEDSPGSEHVIRLVVEDDGYESKRAVTAFHKLRSLDGVKLIYGWGTEPALALAPLAERYQIPLIAGSLDPRTSRGRNWVIRGYPSYDKYAFALRSHLETLKVKRAAAIVLDLSFFRGMSDGLQGGNYSVDNLAMVSPDEHRFEIQASRFKAGNYDALGIYLTTGQILELGRQFQNLRVKPRTMFGPTQFYNLKLLEDAGGFFEGLYFPHITADSDFEQRYIQKYGKASQLVYAASAYEFVMLLLNKLVTVKVSDRSSVRDLFNGMIGAERQSVCGNYRLISGEDGLYFDYPVGVYQIRHGKPVLASTDL